MSGGRGDGFGLAAGQASVYTPDGALPVARLVRELLPRWSDRFEEPAIASHPSSAQPRVLLRSPTGMWRVELAADRADLYWIRPAVDAPSPSLADFFTIAAGMLGQYVQCSGNRVGRMAALVSRTMGHVAPARFLVEHCCRPALAAGALAGAESFAFDVRRRLALGPFVVNGRLEARAVEDATGGDSMVVIDQDVNTLAEQAAIQEFAPAQLGEFFALAAREHEAAFARFYPGAA